MIATLFFQIIRQLIRVSWSDSEASCLANVCWEVGAIYGYIQYQSFSINKNENGFRQRSSKYTSIHQITPLFWIYSQET